jgi:hypothetical protein
MNEAIVTVGLQPLTINSRHRFELSAEKDGLPWNIAGGAVKLLMTDPAGASHVYTATLGTDGFSAFFDWTVIAPTGAWFRAWDVTDAAAVREISLPIVFDVISSPT